MADTQRTRAALLALTADNVTGAISPQDLRDLMVTAMQEEFVNANDFWNEPISDNITTDLTTRGWHLYSQVVASNLSLSFGKVYCMNTSGAWSTANASQISHNTWLGTAADSYASGATTAKILKRGIVYDSSLATRLTGNIAMPIYLFSATDCSFSITNADNWSRVIGVVLPAGVGSLQCKGKFFFCPQWGITGA
jgi:hypothetical protein